jgi:hypothetical protein
LRKIEKLRAERDAVQAELIKNHNGPEADDNFRLRYRLDREIERLIKAQQEDGNADV